MQGQGRPGRGPLSMEKTFFVLEKDFLLRVLIESQDGVDRKGHKQGRGLLRLGFWRQGCYPEFSVFSVSQNPENVIPSNKKSLHKKEQLAIRNLTNADKGSEQLNYRKTVPE